MRLATASFVCLVAAGCFFDPSGVGLGDDPGVPDGAVTPAPDAMAEPPADAAIIPPPPPIDAAPPPPPPIDAEPPADAPGPDWTGVDCGPFTCEGFTPECCVYAFMTFACLPAGTCTEIELDCDGPEDCDVGDQCCFDGQDAACSNGCGGGEDTLCHTDGDCPGDSCQPSQDFPYPSCQ